MSLIYTKMMSISIGGEFSDGKIINLISNDVQLFEESVPYLQFIVMSPAVTIIVLYLLWNGMPF